MAIHGPTTGGDNPVAKPAARARPLVLTVSIILINFELLFLAVWSIHEFGSISAGIAYVNGDRLLVDPYILSFRDLRKGDFRTMELTLDNRADHGIEIRSASRSGMCSVLHRFPIAISPGRRARIPIAAQPEVAGSIEEYILLFTDDKHQPFIKVTVKAKVLETAAQNASG